jgi:hypothetical protein
MGLIRGLKDTSKYFKVDDSRVEVMDVVDTKAKRFGEILCAMRAHDWNDEDR